MKFNVKNLISTVEQKIKEAEAWAHTANADELAKVEQHRQEWLDTYKASYSSFADKIKEKLLNNQPILRSDIPEGLEERGYRVNLPTYSEYQPKSHLPMTGDLPAILKVLKSITDEEITPTALKSLGFQNLRDLF
ncbi:hypothetical protein AQ436_06525 [Arthrobacter sp. EpRS66]|nr:hypothetical protein AQ436_06525 [Arthrobacter sp. EpRS66]